MTTPQNRQLNDAELELLSAYIDNQLEAAERGVLEQRLGSDPAMRAALDELRGTIALLHELAPLPPPRSFALDPAAFAPRPSPLFGWLRLGATLASVLLAITFAVEFANVGIRPASAPTFGGGAAPAAAAPTAAPAPMAESQRSALSATEAPAAAGGAVAAEPTAAPAAAAPAAPPQPTAAPAAAEAPPEATVSTKAAGATAAPEPPAAAFAQPTPSAEATVPALESADTSAPATPTAVPTLGLAQGQGYNAPPTSAPVAASGNQAPNTGQFDSSAPQQTGGSAPRPAIRPIRLIQLSLAALALLLGLGALWVRRRGR